MIIELPNDFPVNGLFDQEAMRKRGLTARYVSPGHIKYIYAPKGGRSAEVAPVKPEPVVCKPSKPVALDVPAFLRKPTDDGPDAA